MGFDNLRVKIEYANPAKKIVWVQLNVKESPTINDFMKYLSCRLRLSLTDSHLYLDDAVLLPDEYITIIRDQDHLKFVPIHHANDDINLPIRNQTSVVSASKIQTKNYTNQHTQTYDLSIKYCLNISTQTELQSLDVFQNNHLIKGQVNDLNKCVNNIGAKKFKKHKKEVKKVASGIGECLKQLKGDYNNLANRDEIDDEPSNTTPMEVTEQKQHLNLHNTDKIEEDKVNKDVNKLGKIVENKIVDINNFGVKIPLVKKRRMDKRRNKNKMNIDSEIPKNNHIIYSDSDKEENVVTEKKETLDVPISNVINIQSNFSHEVNQSPTNHDLSLSQNETPYENKQKFKILNKDIKHHKINYQNRYNTFKPKNIQFNEAFIFKDYNYELLPDIPIYDLNFTTYQSLIETLEKSENKLQKPSKIVETINTGVAFSKNHTVNMESTMKNLNQNHEIVQPEVIRLDETIHNNLNDNITINGGETMLNDALRCHNKRGEKTKNIILHNPPKKGTKIIYKILELDINYNPIISKYKEANVLEYDHNTNTLSLLNITPSSNRHVNGRFSMQISEDDQTNVDYCLDDKADSSIIQIEWDRLIEPQIVC